MLVLLLATGAWAARPSGEGRVVIADPPLVCHHDGEDDGSCALVLAGLSQAWAVQVDALGFRAPVPDGDLGGGPELDVYLSHAGTGGAGGAYVTCDGAEADPCVDVAAGDGLSSTPAYIVIDPDTPADQLSAYARHEFAHVLQYATDFEEPFLDLWEGVAVAAEAWTDPTAPIDPGPIADYQSAPWASAVLQDGYTLDELYGLWSYYEYGAAVWVRWLDERHGDGAGSIGPALWAATANDPGPNEPDVLDAWAAVGGDVPGDLIAFSRFRGTLGTGAGPAWLGGLPESTRLKCEGEVRADATAEGEWTAEHEVWPLGMACLSFVHDGAVAVELQDAGDFVIVDLDDTVDAPADAALRLDGDGTARLALLRLPADGFDADDALVAEVPTLLWRSEAPGCACAVGSGGAGGGAAGWLVGFGAALWLRSRRGSRHAPLPCVPGPRRPLH